MTKPVTKWTIVGGKTRMPSGIQSIAPVCRQPARRWFNTPLSVFLGRVTMLSVQRSSRRVAGSTKQAPSLPLDYWIGMRYSRRMIMMRTGRILDHRVVGWAVLAMAITMMTARVRRTRRAVRKEQGKERGRKMGMGNGRRLRTGRGRGRQQRKWRDRGWVMGKGNGKVLLNKQQEIKRRRAVEWLLGAGGMGHGGLPRAGIFRASCWVNFFTWWYWLYRGVGRRIWPRTWLWWAYAPGGYCGHTIWHW